MIASQFNLDHRLAELRQAGADHRFEQAARPATGHPAGGPGRGPIDSIRALFGGSPTGRRTLGVAAR